MLNLLLAVFKQQSAIVTQRFASGQARSYFFKALGQLNFKPSAGQLNGFFPHKQFFSRLILIIAKRPALATGQNQAN